MYKLLLCASLATVAANAFAAELTAGMISQLISDLAKIVGD